MRRPYGISHGTVRARDHLPVPARPRYRETDPEPDMNSTRTLVFVAAVAVVVAVIAVVPLVIDTVAAARWRRDVTKELIGRDWSNAETRALLTDLREPRGAAASPAA